MDWKEIFKEGVELVLATYSEERNTDPEVKCAIIIEAKEIFDLHKVEVVAGGEN